MNLEKRRGSFKISKYDYKEEDLKIPQRSQLVLEMNPVRKSVPILIHEGKPVCDSAVILEYIDEMSKEEGFVRLLPEDAHERALARFWETNPYFGGNEFGFLDLAFIPFSSMFHGYESHGNFELEIECPKLSAWVKRCMARESVSKVLPDSSEMYELHKKWYGID
ncbi:S-crystallin [Trema orientale]|uniref:glutathione transferase n=1 Tax=Trema orientale TaxID=63057 RepID=A0A2P5EA02_TREOI|nr:S-crystallin [Trema orientale]